MSGPSPSVPLDELPAIPRDDDGPVFSAPWQAQAFAMAVNLHARGAFTWKEWSEVLGREIASESKVDAGDAGTRYYEHWLAALERLATEKRLTSSEELATRRAAWKAAAEATPHGEPIVLDAAARRMDATRDTE